MEMPCLFLLYDKIGTIPLFFFIATTGLKYYLLKWGCGVDQTIKRKRLRKVEKQLLQDKITNIEEDPFWKKFLDINMVICLCIATGLHAYFA